MSCKANKAASSASQQTQSHIRLLDHHERGKQHICRSFLLLLVTCLAYLMQPALAQQTTPSYPSPLDAPTPTPPCPSGPLCQCKWIVGKKVTGCEHELVVGVGSNVSLLCSARSSPPSTFVWFQDEKSLPGNSPASTKLLEEKRYEIAEEVGDSSNLTTSILYLYNLQLSDTSLFLCWVENGADHTMANFSLVVNDSPPAPQAGGFVSTTFDKTSGFFNSFAINQSEAQITILSLGSLLILVAAIICLFIYKHIYRESKSIQSHEISTISSSNKFSDLHQASKHRISDSDDEEEEDEEEGDDNSLSGGFAASCPKVMASGELEGFIEHMRSGIINMDYHQMSPVIQFNTNTLKKQQQQQQHQLQYQHQQQQHQYQQQLQQQQQQQYPISRPPPYLDYGQPLHHFASPNTSMVGNTSQVPYYADNPNFPTTATNDDQQWGIKY